MRPHAQVWSEVTTKHAQETLISLSHHDSEEKLIDWTVRERTISTLFFALICGMIVAGGLGLRRFRQLHEALKKMQKVKSIGNVSILSSSEIGSPFSYRFINKKIVAMPLQFFITSQDVTQDLKIALQHEFQHHRNGDTLWIFWLETLKTVYYWNPLVNRLTQEINLIQEFACDEFLIKEKLLSPRDYGGCLLRVAESTGVTSQTFYAVTIGMAGKSGSSILRRRIQMLLKNKSKSSKRLVVLIGIVSSSLMMSFAYAAQSAVQDKVVTLVEAQSYALKASKGSAIPLEVNDLVLAKMNYYLGTAQGRAWVSGGLARMKKYETMINRHTKSAHLPQELLAIPLYESAYQNGVVSPSPYKAAGIWQFVPGTAKRYHLAIDEQIDERLNPEKETEAAMLYLSKLNQKFHDWRLALKAYNEGERELSTMISKYKTTDAWVLERAESSEDYLSGAIALMIVMKNRELLTR